jgi:hypothetical protein
MKIGLMADTHDRIDAVVELADPSAEISELWLNILTQRRQSGLVEYWSL